MEYTVGEEEEELGALEGRRAGRGGGFWSVVSGRRSGDWGEGTGLRLKAERTSGGGEMPE